MQKIREYQKQNFSALDEQLLWIIEKLENIQHLITTVHNRLHVSEKIQTWHTHFHQVMNSMLCIELQKLGYQDSKIAALCNIINFSIEGILSHSLSERDKQNICHTLLQLGSLYKQQT